MLVGEQRILVARVRVQHLQDRVVERAHPRVDGRILVEVAHRVVLQKRRCRPEADERGGPDVAAAASRQHVVRLGAGDRMPYGDGPRRGQRLVRLGREVVPDVVAEGVGRQGAAGVDPQQRGGHAQFGRQIVAIEEAIVEHNLPHRRLECFGLRPLPVLVPGPQIVRTVRVLEIEPRGKVRQFARMTARAPFGEDDLASAQRRGVVGQIARAAGSVAQVMRVSGREKEAHHGRRLHLGCAPVDRIAFRRFDRNRRNRLAAEHRPEVQQPFLAEQADVEVDAVERAESANRI